MSRGDYGTGSPQERLVFALCHLAILKSSDTFLSRIPSDLRCDSIDFMDEMTSVPAEKDKGTIMATVKRLEHRGVR